MAPDEAKTKNTFAMNFVGEITRASKQEILDRDHAEKLARVVGGDDRKPSEAVRCHSIYDGTQRIEWGNGLGFDIHVIGNRTGLNKIAARDDAEEVSESIDDREEPLMVMRRCEVSKFRFG
jgi:hypothetical protein